MSVGGTPRLLVRLVPKGRDKAADYMIGPETKRNLERVGAMLKDHYQLGPGESLPHVPFNPDNQRAHRFPGKHPYLFQYHGKQLLRSAVTASLRFLCHGMIFQSADGTTVILKPHLLRHVFATHLHQVEHVRSSYLAASRRDDRFLFGSLCDPTGRGRRGICARASGTATPMGGGEAAGGNARESPRWGLHVSRGLPLLLRLHWLRLQNP